MGVVKPTERYPEDRSKPIVWTEERLKWWAASQALGIQYYTGYGPVFCPKREDQHD